VTSPSLPTGAILAAVYYTDVGLWRVSNGAFLCWLRGHECQASASFSPDGHILASRADDKTVWLWRVSDGALLRRLKGHAKLACSVAFSPDGSLVASGSYDGFARLWRVSVRTAVTGFGGGAQGMVGECDVLPRWLRPRLWEGYHHTAWWVSDGKLLRTLEDMGPVLSVVYSPYGSLLASFSGYYEGEEEECMVRVWRTSDGTLVYTLKGRWLGTRPMAFSPDGELLASWCADQMVRLWRAIDGKLLRTLEGHTRTVESVAFSPDGFLLASGSYMDRTVRVWRVSDGVLVRTLEHTQPVWCVAFSPDGGILASGSGDGTVRLWGLL